MPVVSHWGDLEQKDMTKVTSKSSFGVIVTGRNFLFNRCTPNERRQASRFLREPVGFLSTS